MTEIELSTGEVLGEDHIKQIRDCMKAVQVSGLTNMFSRDSAAQIARLMGEDDVADWLSDRAAVRPTENSPRSPSPYLNLLKSLGEP